MSIKLLPCPFCGEKAYEHESIPQGETCCSNENCAFQWTYLTTEEWNTRAEHPAAFPNIGLDPLQHREFFTDELCAERLQKALSVQQKGVPDQTAIVWRIDLSNLTADMTVTKARLKYAQKAVAGSQAKEAKLRELVAACNKKSAPVNTQDIIAILDEKEGA